jgi:hypothetical protein
MRAKTVRPLTVATIVGARFDRRCAPVTRAAEVLEGRSHFAVRDAIASGHASPQLVEDEIELQQDVLGELLRLALVDRRARAADAPLVQDVAPGPLDPSGCGGASPVAAARAGPATRDRTGSVRDPT